MSDQKNGFTRRHFFKGVTLTGVAAAGILPSLAAQAQSNSANNEKAWSWTTKPAPIPAGEIKQTDTADVIIIGAGLAGLCAALSAQEAGAKVIVIDKNNGPAYRGGHITGFQTKTQAAQKIDLNYRQIIRELVRWAQGRLNEELLHLFAQKSGACLDWATDLVAQKGVGVGLWADYYHGPDYTEYPVVHIFRDPKTDERGNGPLVKALEEIAKERGIDLRYKTRAVQFIRNGNGPVTGVIAGKAGNYTQFNGSKAVIIATGDYASNKEMTDRYAPICAMADSQIYFPNKCNTGDGHIMAMQAGGAMQKVEPHAAVIHLESGAMSYGFLHVNAWGQRFKNEDVNTQSKSCSKLFQPEGGIAWTIYDADGLEQVKTLNETGQGGGLFFGQMFRLMGEPYDMASEKKMLEEHIKAGKVVTANTLEELAKKMNVPVDAFKASVERYNVIAKQQNDVDYGKRKELLAPVVKGPFYAGKLLATVLTMSGGLRTDPSLRVLDENDKPVENLYVVGSAQGDFFAADYPTICPGIGHGRCITFGRLAGLMAAGKSIDEVKSIEI